MYKHKYFFPPESPGDDLVFTKFPTSLAYLAGTYKNVFSDIMDARNTPQQKETFRLFPTMMLFRHAVELLLKAILKDVCKQHPPAEHNLIKLLKETLKHSPVKSALGTEIAFVSDAVGELQGVDPGPTFRYGIDKQENLYFRGMPKSVSRDRLVQTSEKLWNALWSVHGPV